MTLIKTKYNRRSFLKASAAAGGGFVLGFSWFASCSPTVEQMKAMPSEWFDINAFLKIGDTGIVTIMSPNPEIGQNIKTSMPMIVAEELDVDWKDVIVEQAPLNTDIFTRQVAGGSQSIRQGWESLRMAGATARKMLVDAAAKQWGISASDCTTEGGVIRNNKGETLGYGAVASVAATMEVPEEVNLKDPSEFKIIGKATTNVDMEGIITGKPLFGLDYKREGMLYACVLRPPAFGKKLVSFDDSEVRKVNGVQDVFKFTVKMKEGNDLDKVAVLASSTWAAIKGQKALKAEWEDDSPLENTTYHDEKMINLLNTKANEPRRADGDFEGAAAEADQVIERVYEAPFLPHNCMEPMNFFANVTTEKAELVGPIQTPEWTQNRVAELLGRDKKDVTIDMTRMGGGFGRRLYGDFVLEAAAISNQAQKPVQVIYTREDDMAAGTYRPGSKYKFKAALKDGNITGYHLVGTGVNMRNSTRENNFPACAIDNYLVESHNLPSNITTGAWRAPVTNFLAYAEQAFLSEVANELGVDAVQLRLDLLERAIARQAEIDNETEAALAEVTGETEEAIEKAKSDITRRGERQKGYDAKKMAGVIKLASEKANWGKAPEGVAQGISAYYSHNTYVAEIAEVVMDNGKPRCQKMYCAIDCGIVINPVGAKNQVEGGIIDGLGHAMFGNFTFENGQAQQNNFNTYRMIRMSEAPEVEVHFVESTEDPTGLGEPTLPPAGGALANAIFNATGKRLYKQPFVNQEEILG